MTTAIEKEINYKDIIQMLPGSWEEMKVHQFEKLHDLIIKEESNPIEQTFSGIDLTTQLVHKLTGINPEELEQLPYYQMALIADKIAFINVFPDPEDCKNSSIQWKGTDSIEYGNWVAYQSVKSNPLRNLSMVISLFSNNINEEQARELNMIDALGGFFLLNKQTRKYLKQQKLSLRVLIVRQKIREMLSGIPGKRNREELKSK